MANSDTKEKIENDIDNTMENMNLTEEMIDETYDEKKKQVLVEKNERRQDAVKSFWQEIKDEF